MKKTRFIYAIAVCVLIMITAVFAGYITDFRPKSKTEITAVKTESLLKKKKCPCCSSKIGKVLKEVEQELIKRNKLGLLKQTK